MASVPTLIVNPRDVTRALTLVRSLKRGLTDPNTKLKFKELESILITIDARTGRRDPSARKKTVATKSTRSPRK